MEKEKIALVRELAAIDRQLGFGTEQKEAELEEAEQKEKADWWKGRCEEVVKRSRDQCSLPSRGRVNSDEIASCIAEMARRSK